jgi:hypothetical protein
MEFRLQLPEAMLFTAAVAVVAAAVATLLLVVLAAQVAADKVDLQLALLRELLIQAAVAAVEPVQVKQAVLV